MKAFYYFVLSILTAALMLLFALLKINEITPVVDLTPYQYYVDLATEYGCITLLCLFAFGGFIGRTIRAIFGFIIILALLIIIVTTFFPSWIQSILGGGTAEAAIGLLKAVV